MAYFKDVRKQTQNPFLNLYEMDALTKSGKDFHYYFVSRQQELEKVRVNVGGMAAEGIMVYAVSEENPEKILMVRQYRYPMGRVMYELPAGLVDAGETAEAAAVREIKEETGLTLTVYEGGNPSAHRPYALAPGFSDETGVFVFGTVSGEFSKKGQEDTERIEAFFADKEEAKRILREEALPMRAMAFLMQFVNADAKNPFGFLDY